LTKLSENKSNFLASGIARCCSTIIANPFNVIKTRMLLFDKMSEYPSLFVAIRKIYRKEGHRGFLKGGTAVLLRDFPFGGIMYMVYVIINKTFENEGKENKTLYFVSGITAASIATVMTHPFEIIRTHIAMNENNKINLGQKKSLGYGQMTDILSLAYQENGAKFVTKGLLPRLMRKPLINAATLFFYEVLTR